VAAYASNPPHPNNSGGRHSLGQNQTAADLYGQPSFAVAGGAMKTRTKEEQFEDRNRINRAAVILGSRELLVFHAIGNDEVRFHPLILILILILILPSLAIPNTKRNRQSPKPVFASRKSSAASTMRMMRMTRTGRI
jgi:hypothetical protein